MELALLGDQRGWFARTYDEALFAERGFTPVGVQANSSFNAAPDRLRGLPSRARSGRRARTRRGVAASVGLIDEFAVAGAGGLRSRGVRGVRLDGSSDAGRGRAARAGDVYGICKDATRRVAEGLAERAGIALAWGASFPLRATGG